MAAISLPTKQATAFCGAFQQLALQRKVMAAISLPNAEVTASSCGAWQSAEQILSAMPRRFQEAIIVHMQEELLPLFPLQVVLFPRTALPLHIFEERYKTMIGDVLRGNSEFGVVQAGEKGIVNTGCTATIEKVLKTYPDGRMDLITIGRRRFEIIMLNDERSYLRGAVEFFDDEKTDPIPPEVRSRVMDAYNDIRALEQPEALREAEMSDPQLSFQLAQLVPDLDFRQILLATRSEAERMRRLAEFFPSYGARRREIQHVRAVAPTNGHSKRPQGI